MSIFSNELTKIVVRNLLLARPVCDGALDDVLAPQLIEDFGYSQHDLSILSNLNEDETRKYIIDKNLEYKMKKFIITKVVELIDGKKESILVTLESLFYGDIL